MIIPSLLDNDLYNFLMSQVVVGNEEWRSWHVAYGFRNRTFAVPLAECLDLDVVRAEIDQTRALRFSRDELAYLRSLEYFSDEFLFWLAGLALPEVEVGEDHGHLVLRYEGPWAEAIFWETPLLAIVSQSYFERFHASTAEGVRRLRAKQDYLGAHPFLRFVEFGSRRRFSGPWQRHVTESFAKALPEQLIGTSNVLLAKDLNLRPIGTMAHQLMMVTAAKHLAWWGHDDDPFADAPLTAAQGDVLFAWFARYGIFPELLTLLPDTFDSEFFFRTMSDAWFERFAGIRQDSGDPVRFGEQAIKRWADAEQNPQEKRLIFSDGLDVRGMNVLWDAFGHRTNVSFGWGTNLSNDLGFEGLSLVIKPSSVDGLPCVKLSDDPLKATGNAEAIARYRKLLVL